MISQITDIDDCASDPCQNGGSCVDGFFSYECNCADGWTAWDCDYSNTTLYFKIFIFLGTLIRFAQIYSL